MFGSTKKNYSTVTAPGDSHTPAATGGSGRKYMLGKPVVVGLIALAMILLLVFGLLAACGGSDDESSTSEPGIGSAHGPTSITDGIPSGFTQDRSGAATAGVIFTQAVDQAGMGRISGAKLKERMVGSNATAALTEVINDVVDRGELKEVGNSAPAMVTVPLFTKEKAKVSIWAVSVGQSKLGDSGKVGVMTVWGTTTVTLQWIDGDWKAIDWEFQSGPTPEEAMFPDASSSLAEQATAGYYSFFVN